MSSPQPAEPERARSSSRSTHTKRYGTAVAVDSRLRPLDTVRVPVSRAGYRRLQRFAARWPEAKWAIEGAAGLGAPLTPSRPPMTSPSLMCPPSSPAGFGGCCRRGMAQK
jgi:hypothetical protein